MMRCVGVQVTRVHSLRALQATRTQASRWCARYQVMTPLIYKQQLWQTSGHLDNYNEDMFMVTPGMTPAGTGGAAHTDGEQHATHTGHTEHECMGLKPMNCPGHCLMVASQKLSYNDLPVRIADFSTLHRNEASGALGGLTRLRRFQQDDAHVFCTHEQIADEVGDAVAPRETARALNSLCIIDYVAGAILHRVRREHLPTVRVQVPAVLVDAVSPPARSDV